MDDDTLDLFPPASEPGIPRSVLYRLPLSGVGTPQQESLLSYLHRLARAHRVRTADLLQRIVVPRTTIRSVWFSSGFNGTYSKTANGYAKYAEELVDALGELTQVVDIRMSTFLPWLPLLDPHAGTLLHRKPRWCPSCVAEQLETSDCVHHQLLWSCSAVSHCAVHLCELAHHCPSCGAEQLFLSDAVSLGRCTACKAVLGRRDALWSGTLNPRERFYLDSVAAMVAANPRAEWHAQQALFARAIFGLTEAYFGGSMYRFEEAIGVAKRTGRNWMRSATRPQLKMLLEVCYRLDVPPLQLLSAEFVPALHGGEIRCEENIPSARPIPLSADQWAAVRAEVEEIIYERRCVKTKDFAAKHGLNRLRFKYGARETYDRLVEHCRALKSAATVARLEAKRLLAIEVVRRQYALSSRLTRRGVGEVLKAAGLSMLDPMLRRTALGELQELRARDGRAKRSGGGNA